MRVFRTTVGIPAEFKGAVVAIGNFDGVHLGHLSILDRVAAEAKGTGAPVGVVTFEPHPRQFFQPEAPPFRLMTRESRIRRLESVGVQVVFELSFDGNLSSVTAREFARRILSGELGVSHVVVGEDFRFGKNRGGNAADLARFGDEDGFSVSVSPLVADGGFEFSSTAIRKALSNGQVEQATQMLGHHHRIEGRVEGGNRRGRDLGFPTANLSLVGNFVPAHGVYAVRVDVIGNTNVKTYDGVASIGVRPTFGQNPANLEVHLFEFDGNLYGNLISVALVSFLRPELRFDNVDALVQAMRTDCNRSRDILRSKNVGPIQHSSDSKPFNSDPVSGESGSAP